jgi:hypothetical protein
MGKNKTLDTILSILSPAYGLDKLMGGKKKKGKKDKGEGGAPNKPKKEKKKKSKWWDSIGSVLGSIGKMAMKFLPMFLGNRTHSTMRAGVSSTSGMIGMAEPTAWSAGEVPNITGMGSGAMMISHSGYLGTVLKTNPSGANAVRGDLLFRVALDPFIEAWLAKMANFEMYKFRNIAITFHPALPTIVSGRVMGYFESDINNPTACGLGEATMKDAAAHTSAIMVDCWVPHTWVYSFHEGAWLYVNPSCHEPRTSKSGIFSIIAGTDMSSSDIPTTLGDLLISYECEFRNPELNATIPSGSYACLSGVTGMVKDYPFGTEVTTVPFEDSGVTPDYEIPNNIAYSYSVLGPGLVGGSWFKFPIGYYAIVTYLTGTGLSASGTGLHQVTGNYSLQLGPGGVMFADEFCNTTKAYGFAYFKSSGYDDSESGLRIGGLATATTVATCMSTVVCLGGQVPYVNPIWSAFKMVKEELKRLRDDQEGTTPEPNPTATISFSSVSKGKRLSLWY